MPLTTTYVTDLGYPLLLRIVTRRENPLPDTNQFPVIDEILPPQLTNYFQETRNSCPEYSGVIHRKLRFLYSDTEYRVTLPIPANDSNFPAIRDYFLNDLGVDELEVLGERIPNHLLRVLLPKL